MNLKENFRGLLSKKGLYLFLATGGFIGYIPPCPGTYGALQGVLLYWLLKSFPIAFQFAIAVGLMLIGIWSVEFIVKDSFRKDPDEVIIDEITGSYIACIGKESLWALMFSIAVFRIIDILKPFPLKKVEKLRGGWGVMLDDIIAGITTNFLVYLLIKVWG